MPGFNDIIGHEMIKEHFKKAIETNHVSHAYICLLYTSDAADE